MKWLFTAGIRFHLFLLCSNLSRGFRQTVTCAPL
jgi:hypothetical protein